MSNIEIATSLSADFLLNHLNEPTQRDGWFSAYEVKQGIKTDYGRSARMLHVYQALDFLLNVDPPAVQETWMLSDKNKDPILNDKYQHPNIPPNARRFYRALGSAHDYVVVESPIINLSLA